MNNFRRPNPMMTRCCVAVLLAICLVSVVQACPTCKDGISDGVNHANVVRGYFWSILFMMSMPFLVFAGLGLYFYSQVQKARAAQLQMEPGNIREPELSVMNE